MTIKKFLVILSVVVIALGIASGPILAQGRGGGGGGGGNSDPGDTGISGIPARFYFPAPFVLFPLVTGDQQPGESIYETDEAGGVNAVMMGSGNPDMEMRGDINQGQRTLFVQLDPTETGCDAPASFEGIQGDGTLNVSAGIRLWFHGLWQTYDDESIAGGQWLDLVAGGDPQYGHMVVRFETPDPEYGTASWALIFGNYFGNSPGAERVQVQRVPDTAEGYPVWQITGVHQDSSGLLVSRARVTKTYTVQVSKKKTAQVTEEMGLCSAHIDYDITQLQVDGS